MRGKEAHWMGVGAVVSWHRGRRSGALHNKRLKGDMLLSWRLKLRPHCTIGTSEVIWANLRSGIAARGS